MKTILMKYYPAGSTKPLAGGTRMPASLFQKGSGVKRLLELDPDSRIEIHHKSGDKTTYQIIE